MAEDTGALTEGLHVCGVLQAVMDKWDLPLGRPVTFSRQTGELNASVLYMRVMNRTPSGRISKKGQGWLILPYCPFCGVKIWEDPERMDPEGE